MFEMQSKRQSLATVGFNTFTVCGKRVCLYVFIHSETRTRRTVVGGNSITKNMVEQTGLLSVEDVETAPA